MLKPLSLLSVTAWSILSGCRPVADEPAALAPGCTFVFTDCFPVDPCENTAFSLHELLVIEGQGLFLETSAPHCEVEKLAISAPGAGYSLPSALLAGQYHPPNSPYLIVIPIPGDDPFWPAFLTAAAAGHVLWSGRIAYPCYFDNRPLWSAVGLRLDTDDTRTSSRHTSLRSRLCISPRSPGAGASASASARPPYRRCERLPRSTAAA
jgi:hypothetical protein